MVDLDWRVAVVAAATVIALVRDVRHRVPARLERSPSSSSPRCSRSRSNPVVGARRAPAGHPPRRRHRGRARRGSSSSSPARCSLLGPPAVRQARDLQKELPEVIERARRPPARRRHAQGERRPGQGAALHRGPARPASPATPRRSRASARSLLGGMLAGFATVLLLIALLLDGERLVRGRAPRRADPPPRPRPTASATSSTGSSASTSPARCSWPASPAWSRSIVGLVLGVPLTPLLAVNVAVFDLVPQIGGAAGGIPFVAPRLHQEPDGRRGVRRSSSCSTCSSRTTSSSRRRRRGRQPLARRRRWSAPSSACRHRRRPRRAGRHPLPRRRQGRLPRAAPTGGWTRDNRRFGHDRGPTGSLDPGEPATSTLVNERVVVYDGAFGTYMQHAGPHRRRLRRPDARGLQRDARAHPARPRRRDARRVLRRSASTSSRPPRSAPSPCRSASTASPTRPTRSTSRPPRSPARSPTGYGRLRRRLDRARHQVRVARPDPLRRAARRATRCRPRPARGRRRPAPHRDAVRPARRQGRR